MPSSESNKIEITKIDRLGNDLFAKFECTCVDDSDMWKDFNKKFPNGKIKTSIKLTGYNDANFYNEVNKAPREIKCHNCGKSYMVQWFYGKIVVTSKKRAMANSN